MAPANARATLPALMNQATPGLPLWNVTSPVRPDPTPRARHARATPAHAAHTVLAYALLQLACSTQSTLHDSTAQRTRLGARLAAARPTGSPVGLGQWRPAFMMLEATSITCMPCIYGAGHRLLETDTRAVRLRHCLLRDVKELTQRDRRSEEHHTTEKTAHKEHTSTSHQHLHLQPLTGMKGKGAAPQRGRGGARGGTGAPAPPKKRSATVSPGAQAGAQAPTSNFPGVTKAPRNLSNTYGGGARQQRDMSPGQPTNYGQPFNYEQQLLNQSPQIHTPQQGQHFDLPPPGGQPMYQDNLAAWNNPGSGWNNPQYQGREPPLPHEQQPPPGRHHQQEQFHYQTHPPTRGGPSNWQQHSQQQQQQQTRGQEPATALTVATVLDAEDIDLCFIESKPDPDWSLNGPLEKMIRINPVIITLEMQARATQRGVSLRLFSDKETTKTGRINHFRTSFDDPAAADEIVARIEGFFYHRPEGCEYDYKFKCTLRIEDNPETTNKPRLPFLRTLGEELSITRNSHQNSI